jgi:hypothetical protein
MQSVLDMPIVVTVLCGGNPPLDLVRSDDQTFICTPDKDYIFIVLLDTHEYWSTSTGLMLHLVLYNEDWTTVE